MGLAHATPRVLTSHAGTTNEAAARSISFPGQKVLRGSGASHVVEMSVLL